MCKKLIVALVAILASTNLWAQNAGGDIEMADAMRANGMIYVVVAVAAVVMIGLLAFVFATDRKISRVEKELKEK
ncbi:CcmD family protein [Cytophagaceae bacterium DM2B3-1]|uniref:CcmD family protein n=2 Tax=Xanthocytophaga TaxID=3078918 RepID=A0ABT7CMY6_9BACT|nr:MULTISPECIES: CcmD family protein [Xanthocytophaga]MDJ1469863.1 CcmD family protein [Xanthocytophaga flavus]MDJ1494375.1 CcmD family protein [Xanthocytophaga flavus]MDJ1503212.1 CcmD family protein [Xanthocytophaga agilis]